MEDKNMKGKITSLTDDHAVVAFDDGQTLNISRKDIEGQVRTEQEVRCLIVPLGGEDAGRTKLAQDLLNELLKT